jgi:hypothetical protein
MNKGLVATEEMKIMTRLKDHKGGKKGGRLGRFVVSSVVGLVAKEERDIA